MNTWIRIPGTAGAGGSAVVAFSGLALKASTSELIIAAAGGHSDSADNRVVSIRLDQDNPAWVMRMAPSTSVQIDVAYYPDGKPSSRHLYWSAHHVAATDRVMLLGVAYSYGNAWSFGKVDGFNLATNKWDPPGTYADVGPLGQILNPATGDIWSLGDWSVFKWSAATKTQAFVTEFGSGAVFSRFGVFDTRRNQIVSIGFGDGVGYGNYPDLNAWLVDVTGKTRRAIGFNASAGLTQFLADAPPQAGLDYDPVNDKFYFYAATTAAPSRVYVITPNSGTTWDVAVLAQGAGSGTPNAVPAGVYSRFRYVPALRGFAYVDPYDQDIWFLRTAP